MKLADKIRILRKARGLSQEELGLSLASKDNGVSRQSISDWENGKSEPKLDNIRALAVLLNVSFDVLFNEKIDLDDPDVLNKVLTDGYVEENKRRKYLIFWIAFTCFVLAIGIALIVIFYKQANLCFEEAKQYGEQTFMGKASLNKALIMCMPILMGALILVIGTPLLGLKIFSEAKKIRKKSSK